jgi:hypothetical protein
MENTVNTAWRAAHYWPVGTRVAVPVRGGGEELGTVTKENTTTVRVRFDSGIAERLVPQAALRRVEGGR